MSRNNKRNNSVKYGICTNMERKPDGTMCSLCQKKEKQAIRSTKDFVCAECGAPLTEVTAPRPFPTKLLIIILSIILLVVAVVIGILNKDKLEPGVMDTTDSILEAPIDPIPSNDTLRDTIIINDTTVVMVHDTITDTIIKEVPASIGRKTASTKSPKGTYNFEWGTYNGEMRNGIPHGKGTIRITQTHTIDLVDITGSKITVYPGETIKAMFDNGRLRGGDIIHKDGSNTTFVNNI